MNETEILCAPESAAGRQRLAGMRAAGREELGMCTRQRNALLAGLPDAVWAVLYRQLEPAWLQRSESLVAAGDVGSPIFFPTTAIVSLLYVTASGASREVAMVGYEGVAGMFLDPEARAPYAVVVQSPGFAYRLPASALLATIITCPAFTQCLMRYASVLITHIGQVMVASQHSAIEANICRWLLERQDRSRTNELKVTQELIALMLGVRRESVTAAAHRLQEDGVIRYRRGLIIIVDRSALEQRAGECYVAARPYDAWRWQARAS